MSPRKSSTSSGNLSLRPRYLGVEVAGELPLTPQAVEFELRRRLEAIDAHLARFRILRWESGAGLVEVSQFDVRRARTAWNYDGPGVTGRAVSVRTRRAYGTLRKGKLWLARLRPGPRRDPIDRP